MITLSILLIAALLAAAGTVGRSGGPLSWPMFASGGVTEFCLRDHNGREINVYGVLRPDEFATYPDHVPELIQNLAHDASLAPIAGVVNFIDGRSVVSIPVVHFVDGTWEGL
jgi:hypothetical protein